MPAVGIARAVVVVELLDRHTRSRRWRRAALRRMALALRQRVVRARADAVGRPALHPQQQSVVLLRAEGGVSSADTEVLGSGSSAS